MNMQSAVQNPRVPNVSGLVLTRLVAWGAPSPIEGIRPSEDMNGGPLASEVRERAMRSRPHLGTIGRLEPSWINDPSSRLRQGSRLESLARRDQRVPSLKRVPLPHG